MPKTLPMIDMSAPVCCATRGCWADERRRRPAGRAATQGARRPGPGEDHVVALQFPVRARRTAATSPPRSGLTESTVSHHLTQLRRAGLVESERRGMNVYHRPHRDAVGALCTVLDPNCCT